MSGTTMRARPYLHYAPVPGGVYFSGAGHEFVMKGWELLFKVADVCVPLLEHGATEDDLVIALGSAKARPVVRHLVAGLRDHGMLLDPDYFTAPEPQPAERARFAGPIAYLESVSDDPYAAFAAVRAARVAVIGPPEVAGPAARGLARAGIGMTVSTVDFADAVIWCPGGTTGSVPVLPGVPVIPVVLGDLVLLAGPAVWDDAGAAAWTRFRDRALDWAEADRVAPAARPVADALAGALAAQLAFKTLAGVSPAGTALVVHGEKLTAAEIVLGTSYDDRSRSLATVAAGPMPDAETAIEWAAEVSARWTGLVTHAPMEADLPQLPLSLRAVEYRAARSGTVVAWGPEQPSATVAVTLAALRGLCSGSGMPAAGLTEEHWLLDGALRLLAASAMPLRVVSVDELSPATARLRRCLDQCETQPHTIRLYHVPGLDWRLARVELNGHPIGQAWAADADAAVADALGSALARAQVRQVRPGYFAETDESGPRTDSLVFADDETIALLRKQIGVSITGRPERTDPVLGEIPFWFGPVVTEEPAHAN